MSNLRCEHCNAICLDSDRGYTTGCEHYPPDVESASSRRREKGRSMKSFEQISEDAAEIIATWPEWKQRTLMIQNEAKCKEREPVRKIVQANLCLRFYRSAGWTREDVCKMLRDDKRLARVMPRYFDDRDRAGQGSFELDDGLPHEDCEYFAVYGSGDPFAKEELAKHEVV